MLRRISIAELAHAGVNIRYDEAIAVTQRLIQGCRRSSPGAAVEPPYGPPSPDNVYIGADGAVTCVGSDATFAISEVGTFLEAVLAFDTGRVPGAVRYTVARALLDVEAPPFDSLDDFAEALARYERTDRSAAIGALLQRARTMMAGLPGAAMVPAIDRRRAPADIAELRRQLRDADARVYEQQRALDALGAMAAGPPPKRARRLVLAAGLAAGLALIGVGQAMQSQEISPVLVVPRAEPKAEPALEAVALPDDAELLAAETKPSGRLTPRKV